MGKGADCAWESSLTGKPDGAMSRRGGGAVLHLKHGDSDLTGTSFLLGFNLDATMPQT